MPEEFGTRDILEQVDTRRGNVEQDIRSLRSQVDSRFNRVNGDLAGLRSEMSTQARWLIGLFFAGWLSLITSIWLKP